MANLVHDVSRELRDPSGKWTRTGAGLRRLAREQKAGHSRSIEEVTGHVQNLHKGTGRTIGGHRVDLTQGGKYRVGLKKADGGRDTRLYGSPHDAAKALHEGSHHDAGSAAKVAGGARTGPGRKIAPDSSAPKGDERPYEQTPEAKLREMVSRGGNKAATEELTRRMLATEKARVEAENVASGRGGTTRNDLGHQNQRAGQAEALRRIHERTPGVVIGEHEEAYNALQRLRSLRNVGPAAIPARTRQIARLEAELHDMGARRKPNGLYEMPPKAGSPEAKREAIKRDVASLNEDLHGSPYSALDLAAVREDDIRQQLRTGAKRVTVKVPSGSEVSMQSETAHHLLNINDSKNKKPGRPRYPGRQVNETAAALAAVRARRGKTRG